MKIDVDLLVGVKFPHVPWYAQIWIEDVHRPPCLQLLLPSNNIWKVISGLIDCIAPDILIYSGEISAECVFN